MKKILLIISCLLCFAGSGFTKQQEESSVNIKLGLYKHRNGNLYQVIGSARHSETLEPMVVYQALYEGYGLWVRPAKMFTEMVEVDGKQVPRFAYQGAGVTELPIVHPR